MPRDHYSVLKSNTRRRAKRRGIHYDLTDDDWETLIDQSNGRCALTNLEFSWAKIGHNKIRPMAASLDRIDSSKGYTKDNVRLTCFAVNCALSSWGEAFAYEWAKSFVKVYESKHLLN